MLDWAIAAARRSGPRASSWSPARMRRWSASMSRKRWGRRDRDPGSPARHRPRRSRRRGRARRLRGRRGHPLRRRAVRSAGADRGDVRAARGQGRASSCLASRRAIPPAMGGCSWATTGTLERIVEHKDASEAERAVKLCNSGVLCADARVLFQLLSLVKNENAKSEFYLTDMVGAGALGGVRHASAWSAAESDAMGVNSRAELAAAEAAFQSARARGGDGGRGDADRSGQRVLQPRHRDRQRCGDRAERVFRPWRENRQRRAHQGVLPYRGRGDRRGRQYRPVRAAAAGRQARRRRQDRQFR